MPPRVGNPPVVCNPKGRPFAVAGDADLLALFRYVSVAYRFTSDTSRPTAQGAVGRVFASRRPETCCDVQSLDSTFYHRAKEAVQCNVNTMLVVPIWDLAAHPDRSADSGLPPAAICELVMKDLDVDFVAVMKHMITCLEVNGAYNEMHVCCPVSLRYTCSTARYYT